MKKILIVDDEVQILKAMSRLFMEKDYEIYTAENGMSALTLLANTEIDLIISDMRMPLMNGNELLSTVKEKYPKIIRIILSGYADEKSMFKALLHNVAKLYIFKPWKNAELLFYSFLRSSKLRLKSIRKTIVSNGHLLLILSL